MPKIQLRVYSQPGQAEVFVNFRKKDGTYRTYITIVDTGAQISFFPDDILEDLEHRLIKEDHEIEQAGLAEQTVRVKEAYIKVFLEDISGTRTEEFEIVAWFGNTTRYLAGFGGILDRAVLHLDMPNLSGYLEFPK